MDLAHAIALALIGGMFSLALAARRLHPALAWAGCALIAAGLIGLHFLRS